MGAGRIAQQDPPAATVARRGRTVRVWLSTGGVRGVGARAGRRDGADRAACNCSRTGWRSRRVSEVRSNDLPADVVVAQDPPAGSRAAAVSLLVNRSDRAAAYVMPDLIGVNGARAADVLRTDGFRVAVVGQNPYPGVPAGIVIRQSPQAGFQVTPGDTVSLEVSR